MIYSFTRKEKIMIKDILNKPYTINLLVAKRFKAVPHDRGAAFFSFFFFFLIVVFSSVIIVFI